MQFVNFDSVEDAKRAYVEQNNRVIPILTGTKQLHMRLEPAKVSPAGCQSTPSVSACMVNRPLNCQLRSDMSGAWTVHAFCRRAWSGATDRRAT